MPASQRCAEAQRDASEERKSCAQPGSRAGLFMGVRWEGGCGPQAVSDLNCHTYRKLEPLEAGVLVANGVMWLRQQGGGAGWSEGWRRGRAHRAPTCLPAVTQRKTE